MPDTLPPSHQPSTPPERARYWWDVRQEAWKLSREKFQIHHEIFVAAIAFIFVWSLRGWDEMVNELYTSLLYVGGPIVLYLPVFYVFNFVRAMVRVPVSYQREVTRLKQELKTQPDPALDRKRGQLQHYINTGNIILNQCKTRDQKYKLDESFPRWEAEVSTYLQNFFGVDDGKSFLDSFNYIHISHSVTIGIPQEEKETYFILYSRILWLQWFLGEIEKNAVPG